ncbi:hypothetical protein HDV05_002905, partial [Chytridiales sp. JEL 0842]
EEGVRFADAKFQWTSSSEGEEQPFTLDIPSLEIPANKLTAIVGPVGSGKSSLLSALISDMHQTSGPNPLPSTTKISYAAQDPWIPNGTLRDIITFGSLHPSESKLQKAVQLSCLSEDLHRLPAGLDSEIGERGNNLSGGQRARIALARSIYHSDADLFLLDDVLSALDSRVASKVFEGCIREGLEGKTRILVTHALQFVERVDFVVVLEGGKVVERGEPKELLKVEGGVLRGMLERYVVEKGVDDAADETAVDEVSAAETTTDAESETGASSTSTTNSEPATPEKKKEEPKDAQTPFLAAEDKATGGTSLSTFLALIRATGGFHMAAIYILLFIFWQGLTIFGN